MKLPNLPIARALFLSLSLALSLGAAPALAEKPDGAGKKDKSEKHENKREEKYDKKQDKKDSKAGVVQRSNNVQAVSGSYFGEPQRVVVRTYYGEQFRTGRCPPGLAKKNNGCLPPGQAKKWGIGQPLPREVVYYSVPQPLLVQLNPAPVGHRYVRVAADILLIAIGTGLVIDAIEDLSR
ncbi:MAG: RcnB family protein [Burkholderiales bacterium]